MTGRALWSSMNREDCTCRRVADLSCGPSSEGLGAVVGLHHSLTVCWVTATQQVHRSRTAKGPMLKD